MRISICLLTLVGLNSLGCKNDQQQNAFTESSRKAWVQASEVKLQTLREKPRQVSLDDAMTFIENYQKLVANTPVPDGFDSDGKPKTRPLQQLLHSHLCDTCKVPIYPSYNILISDLKKIIEQSGGKATHLRIYPALRIAEGNNYYTMVLLAADSTKGGEAVLTNRDRKKATAQDNQIWEYIEPCPPPRGCQNLVE